MTRKAKTAEEIKHIAEEENVRFLRLMFTDIMGTIKNVEVPVSQLDKVCLMGHPLKDSFVSKKVTCIYTLIYLHG